MPPKMGSRACIRGLRAGSIRTEAHKRGPCTHPKWVVNAVVAKASWPHILSMARISAALDANGNLLKLGSIIRGRRKAVGLSQEALADAAAIDRAHLGKIERGERNVTILNILRIAMALDCRASDLLSESGL